MSSEGNKKPRVHDDPTVREVYANKLVYASFDGGPMTVTVGVNRMVPERLDEPVKPGTVPDLYITGRLAISPALAVELINTLQGLLSIASRLPVIMPGQAPVTPVPAAGKPN